LIRLFQSSIGIKERLIRLPQACNVLLSMRTIKLLIYQYSQNQAANSANTTYSPRVVEEALEQLVVLPHLSCLQTKLQIHFVAQADAHDLVQVIAG
jgi:hypothetical protein